MRPDALPDGHSQIPDRPAEGLAVQGLCFRERGPFSFHLAPGACVGLTGPSGVGKSLLLRALADLDPHRGEIYLDGRRASAYSGPQWRLRVGYLPATSQWWHETVADHFQADWLPLLALAGLPETIGRKPVSQLSTGERQRLAILRLLCNRPRVLLLDEPTANLDRENAQRMETLIRQDLHARQASALWVSHDLGLLDRVTERLLVWRGGDLQTRQTGERQPA